MGREIRRVPADWAHPMQEAADGGHKPLYDQSYREACEEWLSELDDWRQGERPSYFDPAKYPSDYQFWEWTSPPPDRDYYRPDWPDEERTHFQMYETVSEGTPVSPVFSTPGDVARWCADNGASACGNETASYEAWLKVARGRSSPSLVIIPGRGVVDGVQAAHEIEECAGGSDG